MAVIAAVGRKGGVGKTSLVAHVAGELADLGRSVRLIDTDPQGSLTQWARLGSGLLSRVVTAIDAPTPERFRQRVQALTTECDHVLIDTPPGFADAALLATLVADLVLLPVGPSPLDLIAAREALRIVTQPGEHSNGTHAVPVFVPNRINIRTHIGADLPRSLRQLGARVLPGIAARVAVAEAALAGLTLAEFLPTSPAREEFRALTRAIERIVREVKHADH